MNIFDWLKKRLISRCDKQARIDSIKWYPSDKGCVRRDMTNVQPHQMPPLMVRKPAWRR